MSTPSQQALALLRYSRGVGTPLPTAIFHWQRHGAGITPQGIGLANRHVQQAAGWLRLSERDGWSAAQWRVVSAAAIASLEAELLRTEEADAAS